MFGQLLSGAKSHQQQAPPSTVTNVASKQQQQRQRRQPLSAASWSFLTLSKSAKAPKGDSTATSLVAKAKSKKTNKKRNGDQQSRKVSAASHTPTVSSSSGYNSGPAAALGGARHQQPASGYSSSSSPSTTNGRHYATAGAPAPAHYPLERCSDAGDVRTFQHRLAAELNSAAVQLDPSGDHQQRPARFQLMQVAAPMVPVMIDDDDDDHHGAVDGDNNGVGAANFAQLDHQRGRPQAALMIDGQLSSLGDDNANNIDDDDDDDDELDVSVDGDDTAGLMLAPGALLGSGPHFYSHGIDHEPEDRAPGRPIRSLRSRSQRHLEQQQPQLYGQQRPATILAPTTSLDYQLDERQQHRYQQIGPSSERHQGADYLRGGPALDRYAYQPSASFSYHQQPSAQQLQRSLLNSNHSHHHHQHRQQQDTGSQFQANRFAYGSSGSKSLSLVQGPGHNCAPTTVRRLANGQPTLLAAQVASCTMQAAPTSNNHQQHLAPGRQHWVASASSPELQQHQHQQRSEASSKRKAGHTNSGLIVPTTPLKQHYLVHSSQSSSSLKLLQQKAAQQLQMPPPTSFQDSAMADGGGGGGGQQLSRSGARGGSGSSSPPLSCCGKLAKFLLFVSNVLFWSAGLGLGAWGILVLIEDHKYNLSQLLVFEPSSRMSLFQLLAWSFIALGCATILVGFCGCSAIVKNNRWILGLFIFLILAIFALDLATGLLAIIFQERLVANIRLRLVNKLRTDYGVQASFTAAIDYIQTKYECCGLDGHLDYEQSLWRLQRLGGFEATVARTCCHLRNTFDDQAHVNPRPVNESMCQSTDVRFHQSYRYRRGCLDDLERLVRHKIWTFTIGCGAVGIVILVSLLFATCFCRSIPSGGSRKSSSAFQQHGQRGGLRGPIVLSYVDKNNKKQHFAPSHGTQAHYR